MVALLNVVKGKLKRSCCFVVGKVRCFLYIISLHVDGADLIISKKECIMRKKLV